VPPGTEGYLANSLQAMSRFDSIIMVAWLLANARYIRFLPQSISPKDDTVKDSHRYTEYDR
jgi:hypothetical protein